MQEEQCAEQVASALKNKRNEIADRFLAFDPKATSKVENWQNGRMSGVTQILTDGHFWEKAGVNFSQITGSSLPESASKKRPDLAGGQFFATGVSIVFHPFNPHIPTSHCNVRYFEVKTKDRTEYWFGGGFDLTPYLVHEDDYILWHKLAKQLCDRYDVNFYQQFKANCDTYFFLPHRNEHRGVGGIFFDDLVFPDLASGINFSIAVLECYTQAYLEIAKFRVGENYSKEQIDFMHYRRGRYVEFNLLYDRGTLFGLQSKGRSESILMSLPPTVKWMYDLDSKYGNYSSSLKIALERKNWIENYEQSY